MREIEKRDWIQSDLATRTGLSRQAISDYVNGKRRHYEPEALVSIAVALNLPAEEVFRIAGLLPTNNKNLDELFERIRYLYSTLEDPANRMKVLEFLEFLHMKEQREDYLSSKNKKF